MKQECVLKPLEFEELVMQRYAAKSFDGKKVPQEQVERLLDIIRHAASSFNLQPWKIKVISDQATKESLSAAAYHQRQITTSSHLLVFCADTDIEHHIDLLEQATGSAQYAESMRSFNRKLTDEQRLVWAQRQLYLALGNTINGAKALGFDSCPMEGFDPQEFARILQLPKNLVPTALCPIGFANDTARPKLRLVKEEIFF